MILNEMELLRKLAEEDPDRRIIITPIINVRQQFQPASFDLRLGTEFKIIKNVKFEFLDLLKGKEEAEKEIANYTEDVHLAYNEKFVLHPDEFALGCTLEYLKLPNDIAARLEGKSTWGRAGLEIHSTAGFVDPGFEGCLTFELQNVGKVPIPLYPGLRVAQISFYAIDESFISYNKKTYHNYGGYPGTIGTRYYNLPELEVLRKLHRKHS